MVFTKPWPESIWRLVLSELWLIHEQLSHHNKITKKIYSTNTSLHLIYPLLQFLLVLRKDLTLMWEQWHCFDVLSSPCGFVNLLLSLFGWKLIGDSVFFFWLGWCVGGTVVPLWSPPQELNRTCRNKGRENFLKRLNRHRRCTDLQFEWDDSLLYKCEYSPKGQTQAAWGKSSKHWDKSMYTCWCVFMKWSGVLGHVTAMLAGTPCLSQVDGFRLGENMPACWHCVVLLNMTRCWLEMKRGFGLSHASWDTLMNKTIFSQHGMRCIS